MTETWLFGALWAVTLSLGGWWARRVVKELDSVNEKLSNFSTQFMKTQSDLTAQVKVQEVRLDYSKESLDRLEQVIQRLFDRIEKFNFQVHYQTEERKT